jgi:hypothetical protein
LVVVFAFQELCGDFMGEDGEGNACSFHSLHVFNVFAVVCSTPNGDDVNAVGHAFKRTNHVGRLGVPPAEPTEEHFVVCSLLVSAQVGVILFALLFGLDDFKRLDAGVARGECRSSQSKGCNPVEYVCYVHYYILFIG